MRPLGVCNSARSTHIQAPCRSRRKYLLMFSMPSPWQLQSPYSLESMCCWGFSSFYNIPSASSSSALWMRSEWSELRHAAWAFRNAPDDYTQAANRIRVAWEAVLLLRSGCNAGELVSERLSC